MLTSIRRIVALLGLFALLAACAPDGGAGGTGTTGAARDQLNLDYVPDNSTAHKLDVFLPPQGDGPYPVVIWVHGGGWAAGDKADIGQEGDVMSNDTKQLLLQRGYAVAAPNYRLVPDTTFPEPMQDVAASVRYLRANAADLELDPERFALMGDSAGGHLAAMVAMTPQNAELQGSLGADAGTDSSVKAFVGYYGLYDLTRRSEDQNALCGRSKPGAESSHGLLIGADPDTPEGEPIAAKASPVTYVSAESPPTLLFQGREDCTAPSLQAERYADALKAAGVPTELTQIQKGHADPMFFQDPALQKQLITFLDTYVKG